MPHIAILPGRATAPVDFFCQFGELSDLDHHVGAPAVNRALEHHIGHGDHPAPVLLSDEISQRDLDIIKKHLIEAALAGHLDQRPYGDAGAFHIDQQIAEALMLGRVGIGPTQQGGEVGAVSVGGPDLGTVDQEVVAPVNRPRLHCGQVGAVVGLGQALAPDFFSRRNPGDIALLLFRRAPLHQRRSHPRDALKIDRGRSLGAVEFLIVNDLLDEAGATSAILLGPVDAHPAVVI